MFYVHLTHNSQSKLRLKASVYLFHNHKAGLIYTLKLNFKCQIMGCLGGSVSLAANSWIWLRSRPWGHGILGLLAESAKGSLPLPLPPPCSFPQLVHIGVLSLSGINKIFICQIIATTIKIQVNKSMVKIDWCN